MAGARTKIDTVMFSVFFYILNDFITILQQTMQLHKRDTTAPLVMRGIFLHSIERNTTFHWKCNTIFRFEIDFVS
jgi:hypothetical protein